MKKKIETPKHILIPKHAKISDKEKSELLKKYDIGENSLPKILATDPAVSGMSAKPGDVIRISRKSPTAGEAVFYRVVINE